MDGVVLETDGPAFPGAVNARPAERREGCCGQRSKFASVAPSSVTVNFMLLSFALGGSS